VNGVAPGDEPPDDFDARYRRASALDSSRPGESVRRSVLDHAARVARERSASAASGGDAHAAGRRRRSWRQPALVGTLAAACLAGLLLTPHVIDRGLAPTTSGQMLPSAAVGPRAAPRSTVARLPDASPASAPAASASAPTAPASSAAASASSYGGEMAAMREPDAAAQFRQAAKTGNVAQLKRWMSRDIDLEARDADGRTALWWAARRGQTAAVQFLLQRGANPAAADSQGITPKKAAQVDSNHDTVEVLDRALSEIAVTR
jgi:hypothetical protein